MEDRTEIISMNDAGISQTGTLSTTRWILGTGQGSVRYPNDYRTVKQLILDIDIA